MSKYFADVHFHVMTFKEPNFSAFLQALDPLSLTGNGAKDYIVTPQTLLKNLLKDSIENTMTAFAQPIGSTFQMMENDLKGRFRNERNKGSYPDLPYIREGQLHFRDNAYDKILLCPLLMDFSQSQRDIARLYYTRPAEDKITPYALDTIEGIKRYYEENPEGLFEFYPFIGINPPMHYFSFIQELLERFIELSHTIHAPHTIQEKGFYGIKLYPPLGTDPWPKDPQELRKMRYIYSFAEKNRIPIITHCDDQGFRGVPIKEAWEYTDPATWRSVLENYPALKIDFAHVGRQYATRGRSISLLDSVQNLLNKTPTSEWFYSLMKLIQDFDNVYTDISFTGAYPEFYTTLINYMNTLSTAEREKLEARLMFGSDFSVNLLKVESYSAYYRIVETSPLDNTLIDKIVSSNPLRFIDLEDGNKLKETKKRKLLKWGK